MGLALTPEENALLARCSPQDVRQGLVAFLHGALGRLARERPTVLLVEDLQRSDVSSLEVLETLVPMIRRLPLAQASPAADQQPCARAVGHRGDGPHCPPGHDGRCPTVTR